MTMKKSRLATYIVNYYGDIFFCAKDGISLGAIRKNDRRIELFRSLLPTIEYTEKRIPKNVTRESTMLRIFNQVAK